MQDPPHAQSGAGLSSDKNMADTQSWPATEQWPSQQWPGTRTTTTPERERIFVRQGSLHTAFLENSPRYEVEDGGLAEEVRPARAGPTGLGGWRSS